MRHPQLASDRLTGLVVLPRRRSALSTTRVLLPLLALALLACTQQGTNPVAEPAQFDLADSEWAVRSLGGTPVQFGLGLTAVFTARTVSGWTGCNSYEGSYRVDGNRLSLRDMRWTEAGCPEIAGAPHLGAFNQEELFLKLLVDAERFEIRDSMLTISTGNDQAIVLEAADGE